MQIISLNPHNDFSNWRPKKNDREKSVQKPAKKTKSETKMVPSVLILYGFRADFFATSQ